LFAQAPYQTQGLVARQGQARLFLLHHLRFQRAQPFSNVGARVQGQHQCPQRNGSLRRQPVAEPLDGF
jgi:hypothetical protein